MAWSKKASVFVVTGTGATVIDSSVSVSGICYSGFAGGQATITAANGTIIWDTGATATSRIYDNVYLSDKQGVTVTITAGGTVWLYDEKKN